MISPINPHQRKAQKVQPIDHTYTITKPQVQFSGREKQRTFTNHLKAGVSLPKLPTTGPS